MNDPPTAVNDAYTTLEEMVLNVPAPGVLGNDTDPDSPASSLTASLVTTTANGTLTLNGDGSFVYTPNVNFFGVDAFTYRTSDGLLQSATATVTITVTGVNDAPSFTSGGNVTVLEDNGYNQPWATAISAGPGETQNVDFLVSNNNNALFAAQPAISPAGVLTFMPAPNANGSAAVSVQIHDDGGTANGGVDTSAVQTFTITVTPVNDAPSFTKGVDLLVLDTDGLQNDAGWATSLSAGPPDEAGQVLDFIVSNDNNALFSSQPSISAGGDLTFTPAVGMFGVATVTVMIHDNGGTANGGVDTSSAQTFTITVDKIPVITSANNVTFTSGIFGTFTVTTSGQPKASIVESGALPPGITFVDGSGPTKGMGVLSGTPGPSSAGVYNIQFTASNVHGSSAPQPFTLTVVCPTITVTNPATTTTVAGAPFSQTFTESGGIGTTTFSTASALPAGVTLAADGTLAGTPTETGSFPITVTATDQNGCTGTGSVYSLTVTCPTITVTNPGTATGTVSTPFSQQFTETGAIGSSTFTTASALPAGLTLSTSGLLSGSPTQPGTFPIDVTVTDANGCTGTNTTYNLVISCQNITVTNPATTSSPAGTSLNISFTESGSIGGATFTTASTLPTGLTLASNGILAGTPMQGGPFPIVVTVTDGNGCTGTNPPYTLTITCPTITVTNPGVSTGTAGTAFSQTFTESGGMGTITWSESGTLPGGITLDSSTGILSGTTTEVGSFPITVTATDQNGCTGTGATYTLTFSCQTITVTNPGVNSGTVDAPFSQTFTASGILATATWSETGTLPGGITLDSASGVLSGSPAAPGSYPISVKVTDTNGCFATSSYTLTISCQTITVTNPATTSGTVNAPFSQSFSQSGAHGTATFTTSSTLPAGLTLAADGTLSGTPMVPGSFPMVVTVTDSNGCTGMGATYNLFIFCQVISITPPGSNVATVGSAYSGQFTESGATGSVTWSESGALPAGITFDTSTGLLSGTPTQFGNFPLNVSVTDSNGCSSVRSFTLTVNCQTITVTNPANTTGTVGSPFSETFTQSGALGGATFATASTLPTGLLLDPSTGILSGTPLQSGPFDIVVTVTDGNGCTGTGPTYSLVITCNVITVTNPSTTTGTAGVAFSQTFSQTGGNGTIAWSESGALPTGITLNTSTGVLSGTTTQVGTFPITVTATDSNGCTGSGPTYTLVINCQTITVTNPGVSTGVAGTAFSQTFSASGILGTVSWSETGALPTGIILNSATGALAGTTTQTGSFPITVTATDQNGCTGTGPTYTLVITCQTITVTNPGATSATIGSLFSATFTASGILGTANWSETGTLPNGVTLNPATGVLSGTPTQTGTYPITVTATDTNSCSGTGSTYTLSVAPVATGDSYSNLVDNTQAAITGGLTGTPATPFVSLSGTIIANDLPSGGVAATAGPFATSAGGSVTIQTDGTFLYRPKANPTLAATTTDSFSYTVTSNTGGVAAVTSAPATVTLNLANRVWYVKNNGGAGNGQSQSPFNTLAAAGTASTANDILFVYNGDGSNSGQNAGISLKNGQQLLGEANGLIVNAQTLVTVGPRPTIGNSAGDGVTVSASAGSLTGVFIKGLAVAGTANGINLNSSGANTLTATVDNVVVNNATANNGIRISGASSATSTITVQNSVVSAATQNGIDAQQTVAGNLVLNLNANTITASATGININGTGSTSTTITNFANNAIGGNTVGSGITVTSAVFDATPGNPFNTVSGGTTVIGAAGNGVGASGMLLTSVKGDLSFTDLDIVNDNGTGLLASSGATFNAAGGTGFQIAVGAGVATVTSAGGPAVNLGTVTASLPFTSVSTTSSNTTGVSLDTVLGSFSAGGSISGISSAAGTSFKVNASNATISYSGTVSATTGKGIDLTNNTGSTISFSGALTLSTGANTAFNATGGGTVTATDTTSTITTTTATAVNFANTNIGAGSLTFRSISVNGAAKGIVLNNTGTAAGNGGLIVTGTGSTAGSGGTIQNISTRAGEFITTKALSLKNINFTNASTSDGGTCTDLSTAACNAVIYLSSVTGVTLDTINISGTTAQEGINGISVSNFTLNNSNITGCGNAVEEGCIKMRELTGSCAITNSDLSFPAADVVEIVNTIGPLMTLNVTGSTLRDNQTSPVGNTGLQARAQGTSSMVLNINNSSILRIRTHGLNAQAINSGSNDIDVTNSTFDAGSGDMIGMSLEADNSATLVFNVENNPKVYARNGPAINVFGDTSATINGRIDNNPDVKVLSSVGNVGSGIRANINKDATARIEVVNNVVNIASADSGIDLSGIGRVSANPGGATNTLNATVTGNNVTIGAASAYGIVILSATNASDTNAICTNVASNAITRNPSSIFSFRARVPSANGFFRMNGFNTDAGVTWNNNGNTPINDSSFGGSGTFATCTATLPTNPGPTP